jgi:hypothetical protein
MGNHLLVMVSSQAGIEWKEEGAINQRCIHGVHWKDGFRSLHCSYSIVNLTSRFDDSNLASAIVP